MSFWGGVEVWDFLMREFCVFIRFWNKGIKVQFLGALTAEYGFLGVCRFPENPYCEYGFSGRCSFKGGGGVRFVCGVVRCAHGRPFAGAGRAGLPERKFGAFTSV
jgi:hypothetical protein